MPQIDAERGLHQIADVRAVADLDAQLPRRDPNGFVGCQREGCATEWGRIQTQEEVVHDWVSDDRRLEDVSRRVTGELEVSRCTARL